MRHSCAAGWDRTGALAAFALLAALGWHAWAAADEARVDGEPEEWGSRPTVYDTTGDSRGGAGSDLLHMSLTDDGVHLYVMLALAWGPNVSPSVLTYNVSTNSQADYYDRQVTVWGDGVALSGSMIYRWVSREADPLAEPATGVVACAGSVVELKIPFALLGGRPTDALWVKASAGDHVTGAVLDEVHFQYRAGAGLRLVLPTGSPQQPGAGTEAAIEPGRVPPGARFSLPPEWNVGDFSEYRSRGDSRVRWAIVGAEPEAVFIENRVGGAAGARVVRYRVDLQGVVQRAWSGRIGEVGEPLALAPDRAGPDGTSPVGSPAGLEPCVDDLEPIRVEAGEFLCRRVTMWRVDGASEARVVLQTRWYSRAVRFPIPMEAVGSIGGAVRIVDGDGSVTLELIDNGTGATAELKIR